MLLKAGLLVSNSCWNSWKAEWNMLAYRLSWISSNYTSFLDASMRTDPCTMIHAYVTTFKALKLDVPLFNTFCFIPKDMQHTQTNTETIALTPTWRIRAKELSARAHTHTHTHTHRNNHTHTYLVDKGKGAQHTLLQQPHCGEPCKREQGHYMYCIDTCIGSTNALHQTKHRVSALVSALSQQD
eukprot:1147432-Pelagomonas_calceolata.AAC.8